MKQELLLHFDRQLSQLENEINGYPDEDTMFKVLPGTTNSAGNLAMHLIGNLRHFYGAILVEDGYVRDRENEFAGRMSREQMLEQLAYVKQMMKGYFSAASESSYAEKYPIEFAGNEITNGFAHLQFLHHFTYHLGQINYHRRTLTAN
ncbi:DinB family protein [Phaeocystidibacter luteus]|uniref:DinB family protein n=1 Tax=Phaeocystidibacter luteus TaxID=911197 RepID=A0A6N6RCY0_9FLAO|nr:DinB family protein [Phaeocystidibacter luteus]KAB2805343.1 DinB family protein [Phaeocystidibacter luteus]